LAQVPTIRLSLFEAVQVFCQFQSSIAMLAFGLLLLAAPLAIGGNRIVTYESVGRVSHLYSFGAPHPSGPMLTRKNGGCFAGFRVIAFEHDLFVDDEDSVPTLLVPFKDYYHPNVETLVVIDGTSDPHKGTWSCGLNPRRFTNPSPSLHSASVYLKLMGKMPKEFARAKEAAAIGLAISYESASEAKRVVEAQDWNMIGTASVGEDVSYLVQDPRTLRCLLTFEGSDSWDDFKTDAKVKRVPFCGLPQQVHLGFRDELRRIIGSGGWQNNIRPHLGRCASVDVTGHSLGGAVATLFAACVDYKNGSDDYKNMSWTKSSP